MTIEIIIRQNQNEKKIKSEVKKQFTVSRIKKTKKKIINKSKSKKAK